jgi:acetyl/propionyl-CoA carboxylase alpha subunit
VHGETREEAIADLAEACAEVDIWPVKTNAGFLVRCLENPDFIAGAVDTGLIARNLDTLAATPEPSPEVLATAGWAFREVVERAAAGQPATPWVELLGFRLNAPPLETARVFLGATAVHVPMPLEPSRIVHAPGDDEVVVFEAGEAFVFRDNPAIRAGGVAAGDGSIRAPMPGRITQLSVKAGDRVTSGQPLLTLEAMKMEHALAAPFDGEVSEVAAELGGQVTEGSVLVKLTAD